MMLRRDFDLNLLPVLDALLDTRSVTATAQRLRVSQPTISFALGKLRRHFDDELFTRSGGAMHPTPLATALRAPVRRMIEMVQEQLTGTPRFTPSDTDRTFTLTTSDVGELCFLPLLIAALAARAPGATLRCLSLPSAQIVGAMRNGEVDLAAGYFPDLTDPDIVSVKLFDHPFACIARAGHPLMRPGMTPADFEACEHAVVHSEGRSQEIAERAMEAGGLRRKVMLRSPHFVSLPFLIARSDLVSVVPASLGREFARWGGLTIMPPPIALPRIALRRHHLRHAERDPAVAWFVALMDELFLGRDPTLAGDPD